MAAVSAVPFNVENKTAVVTGAGSGICFAFSKLLLAKKCNVVFADLRLRPETAEYIEKYSSKESKPRATFHKTDVTSWTDLNALFEHVRAEFGTFDLLCPGAGVFEEHWSNFWHPPGQVGSESKDPVDGLGHYATLDINITHPIRATQLAIAEFLRPSDGSPKASPTNPKRIVFIASIVSQTAYVIAPLYVASKHAVAAFVRSMEPLEAAIGVRVNGVEPGVVRTVLWEEHPEKLRLLDEKEDTWVTPEEVAESMLKLAEDPNLGGGTLLEVGSNQTRVVPLFGNMGPSGAGHTASNSVVGMQDVFARLSEDGWGKFQTPSSQSG